MVAEIKIKTVVVEDEDHCLSALRGLLREECPELDIAGIAQTVHQGIEIIEEMQPELVFMDINLPDGDGFEILDMVKHRSFEVIFTTAYDKYALKAFDFSALHYLLKPVTRKDLREAVDRYLRHRSRFDQQQRYELFKENMKKKPTKYILETTDGYHVIDIPHIVKAERSGRFTIIHLQNNKQHILTKYLADFEAEVEGMGFFRIHHSFLVNMKHIEKYSKDRQVVVSLSNGETLEVSQRKTYEFLDAFHHFIQRKMK